MRRKCQNSRQEIPGYVHVFCEIKLDQLAVRYLLYIFGAVPDFCHVRYCVFSPAGANTPKNVITRTIGVGVASERGVAC